MNDNAASLSRLKTLATDFLRVWLRGLLDNREALGTDLVESAHDAGGLAFAWFEKVSRAKRLAKAIGKRVDEFFDRCAAGSFTAMRAMQRVCRMHIRASHKR